MKALRFHWLSRREQVQQSRLMSMLLPARLKYSIIASDVTRLGISKVHSFDSSLQSRFLAILQLGFASVSLEFMGWFGFWVVFAHTVEDPFGATSTPSELFRLFYQLSIFALSLPRSIGPPDFLTALSFLDIQ